MTTVLWVCSCCRISSRKSSYKALGNCCGQMSAEQQQMKASKVGRWKLHGNATVLHLHGCTSSKQTESRWTWEQSWAGSSAAGTQPCSWGDGRVAPSTFSWPGLLVLFAWGYSNDLDTFNLSMPLQGRFLLYSVTGKPKCREVNLRAKLLIPIKRHPSLPVLFVLLS